ncbi:hypothetical protein ACFW7K_23265 [Streptomyces sp. NPDC058735]|uniref:hypothetical protein n=1 Tax=Streptomyces sp. NPDC058735 TaxID=3346616 RepID=UPI0036A6EA59
MPAAGLGLHVHHQHADLAPVVRPLTSNGEVEYCKCSCNAVVMLCHGEVAALTGLPDAEPDSRDGRG